VPGIKQARCHAWDGLKRLLIPNRTELGHRFDGILLRIERLHWRLAFFLPFFIDIAHITFLNVTAVAQHDIRQVHARVGGVNPALVALAHQVGDVAAVVDVRVGEDHRVDFCWLEGKVQVYLVGFIAFPLEQAAIQQ